MAFPYRKADRKRRPPRPAIAAGAIINHDDTCYMRDGDPCCVCERTRQSRRKNGTWACVYCGRTGTEWDAEILEMDGRALGARTTGRIP